ncbi:MAG: carbohydrate binding family 9 domain-containing protein [Acidobacteria bacterium]|nr:carbohydrate binding family 9 domain-containing protein [Acidobacteriota bacterium]
MLTALFVLAFWAQDSFQAYPVQTSILVDGKLEEPDWQTANPITVNTEWFPNKNVPSQVNTQVRVLFNASYLYFGFRCEDPAPNLIRGHLADRDTPFNDDTVGLMLDTFHDGRRAYQFRVNAAGVQMEAVNSDVDGSEDWSWDAIWESAVHRDAKGWTVEIAIPFKQLRLSPAAGPQTWGVMFMRDFPRTSRFRMRSLQTDYSRGCLICQFSALSGIVPGKNGRNLEVAPTLTSSREEARSPFPGSDLEKVDDGTELGLSVRWGITPSLTLNAAVNPDFSQVEADAAQLNVNQRFALFFPEKRPFFLEGSDYFNTPINAVFTRTLADPDYGLKLTGKQGAHAFGIIQARDNLNNLLFPSNERSGLASLNQEVDNTIVRYRADIRGGSNIGGLFTSRTADGYHNRVYGMDGVYRLTPSDTFRAQILRSETEYAPQVSNDYHQKSGTFFGDAFSFSYNHEGNDWDSFAELNAKDPDFRADTGFVSRVDTRSAVVGGSKTLRSNGQSWFNQFVFGLSMDGTENYQGETTDWGMDAEIEYFGPKQTYANIAFAPNKEQFQGQKFNHNRWSTYIQQRPGTDWNWWLFSRAGEAIDVENVQSAQFYELNGSLGFYLGHHVESSLEYLIQDFDSETGHLFQAELFQSRWVLHFNQRCFLRWIAQIQDITYDTYQLRAGFQDKSWFNQVLFSYKLNPQSVLLAGYSDTSLGNETLDYLKADRTYFVKIGYAWLP